jgi:hypothetical protein
MNMKFSGSWLDSDFVKVSEGIGLANVGRPTLEDAGRFGPLSKQRKQTDPENKRGVTAHVLDLQEITLGRTKHNFICESTSTQIILPQQGHRSEKKGHGI